MGLRYPPAARALGKLFWEYGMQEGDRQQWQLRLESAGLMLEVFPQSQGFASLRSELCELLKAFIADKTLFDIGSIPMAGEYLFYVLSQKSSFTVSKPAAQLAEGLYDFLKKQKASDPFQAAMKALNLDGKLEYLLQWVMAYQQQSAIEIPPIYCIEACGLLLGNNTAAEEVKEVQMEVCLEGMLGEHPLVENGRYTLSYYDYVDRLIQFSTETLVRYERFTGRRKVLIEAFKSRLRLDSFQPRVLSSFVRNQLIDEVYLPLIGDNLAKQIGTVGEETRTDRMGMLLLVSPPGYGKTTLMEYIASRLGLIFMKINGPAIGHEVRSLDPSEAPNAGAREELWKLNLALEMGDNIMLYLDDIQHCHPEFLQKFISLCDAQRKIEGVYEGKNENL